MDQHEGNQVAAAEPTHVNVTPYRRRVRAEDSVRMRELGDQIQTMITELGELAKSYTDLDDDDRTAYRYAPNLARAAGNTGVYIEVIDGWFQGVPQTACVVHCGGADSPVSYVENPCGSGSLCPPF